MDIEFAPDGKLWATGRAGELYIISTEGGPHRKVTQLELDHSDDRGLHGIEFHPGYLTNGFVYLYFSPPATNGFRNRLSRFTIDRSGADEKFLRESEVIYLEWPSEVVGYHQGGAVEYNPHDQKLYISTGDNNWNNDLDKYYLDPQNRAQSLADLRGKTLRINLDGSIPSDNPFVNHRGARKEIYTVGHRQPFTLSVDSKTGLVFEGENGGDRTNDFEEINLLKPGGNYGWPRVIGDNIGTNGGEDQFPGALKPWLVYGRGNMASSCMVGPVYRPVTGKHAFPDEFSNVLYYADHARKWVRIARFNEPGMELVNTEPFARGFAGGPLAVQQGPDGALYVLEYGGGKNNPRDRISRIIPDREAP